MSPRVRTILADGLGVGGFATIVYGLYLIDLSLACIVGGLGMGAAAVLLEKR